MRNPITVWLVEDNATYRRSLARAIDHCQGMTCGRQFPTMESVLDALGTARPPAARDASGADGSPDVLLLDVGLPGMDGITGLAGVRERSPRTRTVILTVFDDPDKIFRAVCAGASGYLLKTARIGEVADAVRQAVEGGAPMTPKVARRVLDLFARLPPPGPPGQPGPPAPVNTYGLTDREGEALQRMVEGLTKKEIAARLDISIHTVNAHLRSIYEKLHVNTNTGAVAKAIREKLI